MAKTSETGVMKAVDKKSKFHRHLVRCAKALASGRVLSVDPSVGSGSSVPGYAIYVNGKLLTSGTLAVNLSGEIWDRLREVGGGVRALIKKHGPIDVLVYEDVPPARFGASGKSGFAQASHASLQKALGACLAQAGPKDCLPIPPAVWVRRARAGYTKSDEHDAIEMGWIAIELAKLQMKALHGSTTDGALHGPLESIGHSGSCEGGG